MKFSTRHDIEAPIDFVFQQSTDFVGFERQALRRGIDVGRADAAGGEGVGMKWNATFTFRGKTRKIQAELTKIEPAQFLQIFFVSGGIRGELDIELLALSRNQTRVKAGLLLKPDTLSARLLIQSLKFAKGNLTARFKTRIQQFGTDVEDRYRKSTTA